MNQMRRVAIRRIFVGASLAFLVSLSGMGQEGIQSARLDIALSKQNYGVGETVIITYKITNLSNSLMCFPPPTVGCGSLDGELGAQATPPNGVSTPWVGSACMADMVRNQDVGSDIDQRWIKLGPSQSFEITHNDYSIGLTHSGRWSLEAGYVPLSKDTQSFYEQALKERGCSLLPELHSRKASVFVNAKAPKHLTGTSLKQR